MAELRMKKGQKLTQKQLQRLENAAEEKETESKNPLCKVTEMENGKFLQAMNWVPYLDGGLLSVGKNEENKAQTRHICYRRLFRAKFWIQLQTRRGSSLKTHLQVQN